MPSLQFVITNRLSLISHLSSNDRSIPLRIIKELAENPPGCPKNRDPQVYLKSGGAFENFGNSAGHFSKSGYFFWKFAGLSQKIATGVGGGGWLGSPSCSPSLAVNSSSFCLVLICCWRSGFFYWCKLSLLMHSCILIFTQTSWDGYLPVLLLSPNCSIRSTVSLNRF